MRDMIEESVGTYVVGSLITDKLYRAAYSNLQKYPGDSRVPIDSVPHPKLRKRAATVDPIHNLLKARVELSDIRNKADYALRLVEAAWAELEAQKQNSMVKQSAPKKGAVNAKSGRRHSKAG